MAGIVYFTTVTTAAGRDNLLKVGGLLFLAAALHNLAGYFFGYWLSRASGLDKNSARSVAFEVGLAERRHGFGHRRRDGQAGHRRPGGGDFQSVDECVRFGAGELLAETAGEERLTAENAENAKMKILKLVFLSGMACLLAAGSSRAGEGTNGTHTSHETYMSHATPTTNDPGTAIDAATVSQWSAPFRGWSYWPTHVIPESPPLPGATNILGTDVPTVFQIPGDDKWYLSFVAFDGVGYQSYVAESTQPGGLGKLSAGDGLRADE